MSHKMFTKYYRLLTRPIQRYYYTVNKDVIQKKKTEMQKNLTKQLQSLIKTMGPITVADYMKEVLRNPVVGYYMKNDMFGKSGDFITSPELGQLFGEMIGVWFLNEWRKIGSPKPFQIIELGPGRGTLCQDIINVFKHFNELTEASIHLVEISPFLSDIQARKLCLNYETVDSENSPFYIKGTTASGMRIYWYKHLKDVPRNFSLVMSNEFFDALPIHKYQKVDNHWKEILIDVEENEKFRFVLSKSNSLVPKLFLSDKDQRQHIEISLESATIIEHLSERLDENGGIALIADYGHYGDKTDTFRAFKSHKLHDPLMDPGSADLTADVDFQLLKSVATAKRQTVGFGPVTQRNFLMNMGITKRLEQLLKHASPDQENSLKYAHGMLIDEDKMGEKFKLLSLYSESLNNHLKRYPPVGFS